MLDACIEVHGCQQASVVKCAIEMQVTMLVLTKVKTFLRFLIK